jgi:hypothetical protein
MPASLLPSPLPEYTADRVRESVGAYRRLLQERGFVPDADHKHAIVKNHLCAYLDLQLQRLMDWDSGPVDGLAWVTRSLMELVFWIEYILHDPQHLDRFLDERLIDLSELVKKALAAFEHEASQLLDDTPEGLAELLAVKGRRVESGKRTELDSYTFKVCSKYIHPSSWLLLDLPAQLESERHRRLFRMMSLRYAASSAALLTLAMPPLMAPAVPRDKDIADEHSE